MLSVCLTSVLLASPWPHYGGTHHGDRYAAAVTLSSTTVADLRPAWTYRTRDGTKGDGYFGKPSWFKATPVMLGRTLIFPTGFNRIIAVDAATGRQHWRFDPRVDFSRPYAEQFTARGVELWRDPNPTPSCRDRVFFGTLDARLWAVDAATGHPCAGFGRKGRVDLSRGIDRFRPGEYAVTSPPVAIGDVVIVGSSIGDNGAARLESGVVRAYDARTGKLRWRFDPTPSTAGGANVWTAMSADDARGLVFLPTTSPSPDFFGGHRRRGDGHANAVVALRAATGEIAWRYRIVRHDLWDYDLASQPLLLDWPTAEGLRPALAQATKMGFVFVLDRETGQPLIDVKDRPVPASTVPGEHASPTQPFPSIRLHPTQPTLPKIWNLSRDHVAQCRKMLDGVRYDGIFTPPSTQGTLLYPGNPGGTNWGSMALDPRRGRILVAVNRLPTVVKLIPRRRFAAAAQTRRLNGAKAQYTAMADTPYGMARFELYNRSNGAPCLRGPWAQLFAIDVGTGKTVWQAPAGRWPGAKPESPAAHWGYFAAGGPLLTAGGLAFLGTPFDKMLRAYDIETGAIVWQQELPAGAHATPMAYRLDGADYLVIAAGGDTRAGDERGDFLIAFKRPVHRTAATRRPVHRTAAPRRKSTPGRTSESR